ncbi:ACP S-malonyltransferase [Verrucomicrobia bacterium]|nr:ACP S-malonyltransferase [Verrucomicrobiota bacterium]MDB4458935.1 ACP S-malonyltransferase [bacterium]
MSKTAFLFAGQGAQFVGMGKDLCENFDSAKALFDQANDILGYDLASICFDGPEDELTKTEHAQPGIYLVSWVAMQLFQEKLPSLSRDATAGLSLGEFTALAAAGSLSFEDGLKVVRQRGIFMQEACDTTKGGMAAIIGMDQEAVQKVCDESGVQLANLNCPGQIVISGAAEKIEAACVQAKAQGAKRALPLPVAGAYHSLLMQSASGKLAEVLAGTTIAAPSVPVISNVTADAHGENVAEVLVQQVTSSVLWEASVRKLIADGFDTFIEFGPGNALAGFMKRIERGQIVHNVGSVATFEKTLAALSA